MSQQSGVCEACGDDYEQYHTPGYCSHECYYRSKGDTALNLLRHNHTLCPSCGNRLKTISEPTDDWRHKQASKVENAIDAGGKYHNVDGGIALDVTSVDSTSKPVAVESVIGFQYRTHNATTAEKGRAIDDYREIVGTGIGCECGTTALYEEDTDIQDIELRQTLLNYLKRFREFHDEGQLDQRIDRERFLEAWKESHDIKYALGVGIYG